MVGDGQHHGEEEGVKDPHHEDGHHHGAIKEGVGDIHQEDKRRSCAFLIDL